MEQKPGEPRHLRLDDLAAKSKVQVTLQTKETAAELKSRLGREDADAAHERAKDLFLYRVVALLVSVVSAVCLIASLLPVVPEDTRKSAFSLLTVIITAAVSFMVGKSAK
jgi:hypothetical protein